ncbi:Mannosyltransferase putative [Seminavis robusta]|uniref:Mannosyltransferase putative n=1 Tax=Seminavis robusta TaxID=568900 RepID=A0A9N8DVS4_9STRA|nr:Mannosyltransferase putative [Seminavis robusta]|eukprot:Sro312_g114620.1 Mannosyltransferase putative (639) ;mRNA; f:42076-43992
MDISNLRLRAPQQQATATQHRHQQQEKPSHLPLTASLSPSNDESSKTKRKRGEWGLFHWLVAVVAAVIFFYLLGRGTFQCIDYLEDAYHDFYRLPQSDTYAPKHMIPLADIPSINWPVITRYCFRPHNARILRRAKVAITELGNELRALLSTQERGKSHPNIILTPWDDEHDRKKDAGKEEVRQFQERLHASAKWLKGNPETDPKWPLSTLPAPILGQKALVTTGGDKQLHYLKTFVYSVRVIHQSTIPIRIVYRDDQDLTEPSKQQILQQEAQQQSDVQFIDLSQYFDLDVSHIKGWNLKAFGILAVPEMEVAMLDADVLLLQPPERLFQAEGYQRTGALFFHDRVKPQFYWDVHAFVEWLQPKALSNERVQSLFRYGNHHGIMGLSYTEQIQEAGVLLIDKARRVRGVWAACVIFGREDIRKYIQVDHMYGDKEVHWSAFEAIRNASSHQESSNYEFSRYYPGVVGGTVTDFGSKTTHLSLDASPDTEQRVLSESIASQYALCGRLVHFDDNGVPLWTNGGYMLKEDDWFSSASISQSATNPVWFIDGGQEQEAGSIPNPWLPWWRNLLQWYGTLKGQNQVWALHHAMGVECLSPNSRQMRPVPTEMADKARRAVRHYFEQKKQQQQKLQTEQGKG